MKIVLSVVLAMLIVGCSDEKSSQKSSEVTKTTQSVKEISKDETVPKIKEVVATQQQVTATVEKTVEKTVAEVTKIAKATPAVKNISSADGAKLFTVCSSCHGVHAEKKALGKSQIIKGWSEAKIITALHGYKNGTYGGAMKAIMKGQASKLSDADINAVAKYISKL